QAVAVATQALARFPATRADGFVERDGATERQPWVLVHQHGDVAMAEPRDVLGGGQRSGVVVDAGRRDVQALHLIGADQRQTAGLDHLDGWIIGLDAVEAEAVHDRLADRIEHPVVGPGRAVALTSVRLALTSVRLALTSVRLA